MADRYYLQGMETVTFKLEPRQIKLLQNQAKAQGRSQGAVLRELIDEHLGKAGRPSLHDLAQDLCGSLTGPRDLSTRKLDGYGRS